MVEDGTEYNSSQEGATDKSRIKQGFFIGKPGDKEGRKGVTTDGHGFLTPRKRRETRISRIRHERTQKILALRFRTSRVQCSKWRGRQSNNTAVPKTASAQADGSGTGLTAMPLGSARPGMSEA